MTKHKNPDIINRHEFLRKLGLGGAALLAVYFSSSGLTSCVNETEASPKVDFEINLDDASNAALKNNGGFIIKNGVVIAKTNTGAFAAVTLTCSHEGNKQITYTTDRFFCTAHGAEFDNAGKGLNSNGSKGLVVYQTSLTGSILRVFE
jgi:Rieske Fe-S protein